MTQAASRFFERIAILMMLAAISAAGLAQAPVASAPKYFIVSKSLVAVKSSELKKGVEIKSQSLAPGCKSAFVVSLSSWDGERHAGVAADPQGFWVRITFDVGFSFELNGKYVILLGDATTSDSIQIDATPSLSLSVQDPDGVNLVAANVALRAAESPNPVL